MGRTADDRAEHARSLKALATSPDEVDVDFDLEDEAMQAELSKRLADRLGTTTATLDEILSSTGIELRAART